MAAAAPVAGEGVDAGVGAVEPGALAGDASAASEGAPEAAAEGAAAAVDAAAGEAVAGGAEGEVAAVVAPVAAASAVVVSGAALGNTGICPGPQSVNPPRWTARYDVGVPVKPHDTAASSTMHPAAPPSHAPICIHRRSRHQPHNGASPIAASIG